MSEAEKKPLSGAAVLADMARKQEPDVYAVIRSPEIRRFLRRNDCMDIFGKEQIILQAYISVHQKAEMLKKLSMTGDKEESELVYETYSIYKSCMADIFHPVEKTVFILEAVMPYLEGGSIRKKCCVCGFFQMVEELVKEAEILFDGTEKLFYAYIYALHIPQSGGLRNPFDFTMFWLNGRWQVKDVFVGEESPKFYGFSEDTKSRLCGAYVFRFPLPFEDRSRLKLQLPFMEKPFYGILDSKQDANGCWYHFFSYSSDGKPVDFSVYLDGTNLPCIDLSGLQINGCSLYSTFDWLERV